MAFLAGFLETVWKLVRRAGEQQVSHGEVDHGLGHRSAARIREPAGAGSGPCEWPLYRQPLLKLSN
jgi:hypothetical protein